MGTTFKNTTLDWAGRNGCDLTAKPTPTKVSKTTTCDRYAGCAARTEACTIAGMGHKWPGVPGQRRGNINATDYIFRFFDATIAAIAGTATNRAAEAVVDPPGCQDKVFGECGTKIVPGKDIVCCPSSGTTCKPAQPGAPPVCVPN